ncbi:hypothetical protein [Glycomyces buryatensis]|uniref:hypothetical protein n=1 Tax=Glycomyces buryatensis TaxID=2570927 RepID=UPI0014562AF7|nr:hypothetical protein [Glycomyces buryatensis]
MSTDRRPYSAAEEETFGHVDDERDNEESLEQEILEAEGYKGADRHGTTPAEEQLGVSLDEALEDEEPDELGEAVTDSWGEGPDPQAGELHDQEDVWAEESPAAAAQEEIHVTVDDRERAEVIRESGEQGPPPDPDDDEALDEDREQEPKPDDWR